MAVLYTINPDNQTAFQVYCDMDTSGGGWTVIQRRFDGSVSFNRTWSECARGFGNKTGEYWLGLNYIHRLTTVDDSGTAGDVISCYSK